MKQNIERDKQDLRLLEKKVDEQRRKFESIIIDIQQLDAILGTGASGASQNLNQDIKVHGLIQEIEELRKANAALQEEKEWNVSRLMELEDQMGKFKSAIGSSIRNARPNSGQEERSPNQSGKIQKYQ